MKRIFFALSALLAAVVSCTEKEPTGQDEATVATYYLVSNQTEVASLAENRSKDVNLNVKARESVGGSSNLTFNLKTDLSQVDAYNTANGTDYLPMPADAFSFEKPSVTIARYGVNSTTTKVTLVAKGLEAGKTYVLPVSIDEVTGGEYKLDESAQTVYLLLALYSENTGEGEGDTEVDITAGLYDDPCAGADASKTPDLVIKTVEDMMKLQTLLEDGKMKYAVLEADIDMSSVKDWMPLNTTSPIQRVLNSMVMVILSRTSLATRVHIEASLVLCTVSAMMSSLRMRLLTELQTKARSHAVSLLVMLVTRLVHLGQLSMTLRLLVQ